MSNSTSTPSAGVGAPKRLSPHGLFRTARHLVLAGIGITGVLGDEAQALYEQSVERGGGTVKKVRKRLRLARGPGRRPDRPADERSAPAQQALNAWEATLARLNVPTAADIDALTQQVAELEAKIDQPDP